MSRKLRVEEEKLEKQKDVVEAQTIDPIKVQLARIYSPLVWMRTSGGIRIQDMKEPYFKKAIELFEQYYMPTEVLCKNLDILQDLVSVSSFTARLTFYLKDLTSIIAIDESNEEEETIAGVLILRIMNKADYGQSFSRIQLFEGEAMRKYIGLTSYLNRKVNIFERFDCNSYLRYYQLCVLPEYRHKGIGYAMLRCGLDIARAFDAPVVMGLFSSCAIQRIAKRIGMEMLYEVNYMGWLDSEGEMIFDDPGAGNYSCMLMAGKVPPLSTTQAPSKAEEKEITNNAKLTRADKRAQAAKTKK